MRDQLIFTALAAAAVAVAVAVSLEQRKSEFREKNTAFEVPPKRKVEKLH